MTILLQCCLSSIFQCQPQKQVHLPMTISETCFLEEIFCSATSPTSFNGILRNMFIIQWQCHKHDIAKTSVQICSNIACLVSRSYVNLGEFQIWRALHWYSIFFFAKESSWNCGKTFTYNFRYNLSEYFLAGQYVICLFSWLFSDLWRFDQRPIRAGVRMLS